MKYSKIVLLITLLSTSLLGYSQVDTTQKKPTSQKPGTERKATAQQANYSSGSVYTGIFKWSDFIQIYPFSYSPKFGVTGLSVLGDLNAEFVVQDIIADENDKDSDVIVKYLYYLNDKKGPLHIGADRPSITNSVYFFRYNFAGDKKDFDNISDTSIISRNFGQNQKFFLVKLSVFKGNAVKVPHKVIIKGGVGFGVVNYPFKFRIQKGAGDFSGSFNVGAAVAYTYRHDSLSKWSFSHVLGFGISSVTLDKSSAVRDTAALSSTNTFTALTLSYGFLVQYDKVQIGFFVGWDRISNLNNNTFGWRYQGRPWISVGLGYSIFSTSSSTSPSKSDTQP